MKLRRLIKRLGNEVRLYFQLFRDQRTPKISKILIIIAVIYLILPFDIVPDFFPFAGQIDDLIIVPIIFFIATFFIPKPVINEHKRNGKVKEGKNSKFDNVQEGEIVE